MLKQFALYVVSDDFENNTVRDTMWKDQVCRIVQSDKVKQKKKKRIKDCLHSVAIYVVKEPTNKTFRYNFLFFN